MQQSESLRNGLFPNEVFSEPEMTPQVALDISQTRMRAALQAEYDMKERNMRASYEDLERRMREHYTAETERVRKSCERQLEARMREMQKKATEEAAAYERRCRREYDEHMLAAKSSIRDEVIGDVFTKAVWVLRNTFKFSPEQMRKFLKESIYFDILCFLPDNDISINYIVETMKQEGFDLDKTIGEASELALAHMDECIRKTVQPHEGWTEEDDHHLMNGVILGCGFDRIGRWVGKSGQAVKARAYRRWGTSSVDKIRKIMEAERNAEKRRALSGPDTGAGAESAAG